MDAVYALADPAAVFSPALLFYKDLIRRNIERAVAVVGGVDRLRPHVKTHKTREIVQMQREAGVRKFKCATIAEAEMLAGCGAPDVLLAYPLVGPNCRRFALLAAAFRDCRFSATVDDPEAATALAGELAAAGASADLLLDVEVGQRRTGVAPGDEAVALYEHLARLPAVRPGGLHVYDGHNHQADSTERVTAVERLLADVRRLRERLAAKGLPVSRLVFGGTPTFPFYARLDWPGAECSPGTFVLHDQGYGSRFPDVSGFTPAALLLTRVVSRPTANRVTFDLGTKAVASDPPAGQRCLLLDVPDYQAVLHNEEHLVIETPAASRYRPGDAVYAVPTHVCPTVALHRQAYVVEDGRVTGSWDIVARDRVLTF
jgi:D-serine deaminase-like pyridoxal phosphate-dependent protein